MQTTREMTAPLPGRPMLHALAKCWWLLLLRGIAAIFRRARVRLAGIDPGHAGAALRRVRAGRWRDLAHRRLHRQRQAGADLVAGGGRPARDRRRDRHLRRGPASPRSC